MATIKITTNELFEALARAQEAPAEARTARELAQGFGCSRQKVEKVIGRFAAAGRLVVHRVQRPSVDGSPRWVPAYTILPPA